MAQYINGLSIITTQVYNDLRSFDATLPIPLVGTIPAVEPNYKEYISPIAARRMGKGVKMGLYAAYKAMEMAGVTSTDAILFGTGYGCILDSEKFLIAMIENEEQYLTPTPFIQSTHNTVPGQFALMSKCHAYNMTYSNGAVSFPSALLDGIMLLESADNEMHLLVGAVDEIAPQVSENLQIVEQVKRDDASQDFLHPTTKGYVLGEGASYCVLSNRKQEGTVAELIDTTFQSEVERNDFNQWVIDFLSQHHLTIADIDIIILGINGAVEGHEYYEAAQNLLSNAHQLYFKHLIGEQFISPAFAFSFAAQILKEQYIPESMILKKGAASEYKYTLIYNQLYNFDHALILLKNA